MTTQQVPAGFNPEEAGNLEDIEKQFAVKAVQQMLTYWRILERMRGSRLRLTKFDDDIYAHFKRDFPDVDVSQTLDEDAMKSPAGKARWRKFISEYEGKVEDFNFGTMLRNNPRSEYGEEQTIFVVRMQFYAIEIARNREGLNDWIYEKDHPDEAGKAKDSEDTKTEDT